MVELPIDRLYAGRPREIAPGRKSAIRKAPLEPPWRIESEGLVGDRQADRCHHGGAEKALHHYPREHYDAWRADLPELASELVAPAFGENISTSGLTEAEVCVGDVFALGGARLQVSQGRQPCLTLNFRFGRRDMARRTQETMRCGWYYRVLETGAARPGDNLRLIERPRADWPLARLFALLYVRPRAFDELTEMTALPELAESWRALARRRIENRKVEDWRRRLGE
ncbi:MOSC domain-containing protein [Methylocystis sp. FS]|uniref:MOSC domain-containing protein n=1 Tax=Methylocystis silviterrae TaxID=2743612 RepID=UPI0015835CCD|nr:MOSC domain-containing protein [Methylocystis silviterrae]NUJ78472.1 MOSC domain-containing protein [Methylocystis silviterrae]